MLLVNFNVMLGTLDAYNVWLILIVVKFKEKLIVILNLVRVMPALKMDIAELINSAMESAQKLVQQIVPSVHLLFQLLTVQLLIFKKKCSRSTGVCTQCRENADCAQSVDVCSFPLGGSDAGTCKFDGGRAWWIWMLIVLLILLCVAGCFFATYCIGKRRF